MMIVGSTNKTLIIRVSDPRELLLAFPVKQAVSRSRGGRCHPETGYYNDDCDDDNDDCDDDNDDNDEDDDDYASCYYDVGDQCDCSQYGKDEQDILSLQMRFLK